MNPVPHRTRSPQNAAKPPSWWSKMLNFVWPSYRAIPVTRFIPIPSPPARVKPMHMQHAVDFASTHQCSTVVFVAPTLMDLNYIAARLRSTYRGESVGFIHATLQAEKRYAQMEELHSGDMRMMVITRQLVLGGSLRFPVDAHVISPVETTSPRILTQLRDLVGTNSVVINGTRHYPGTRKIV